MNGSFGVQMDDPKVKPAGRNSRKRKKHRSKNRMVRRIDEELMREAVRTDGKLEEPIHTDKGAVRDEQLATAGSFDGSSSEDEGTENAVECLQHSTEKRQKTSDAALNSAETDPGLETPNREEGSAEQATGEIFEPPRDSKTPRFLSTVYQSVIKYRDAEAASIKGRFDQILARGLPSGFHKSVAKDRDDEIAGIRGRFNRLLVRLGPLAVSHADDLRVQSAEIERLKQENESLRGGSAKGGFDRESLLRKIVEQDRIIDDLKTIRSQTRESRRKAVEECQRLEEELKEKRLVYDALVKHLTEGSEVSKEKVEAMPRVLEPESQSAGVAQLDADKVIKWLENVSENEVKETSLKQLEREILEKENRLRVQNEELRMCKASLEEERAVTKELERQVMEKEKLMGAKDKEVHSREACLQLERESKNQLERQLIKKEELLQKQNEDLCKGERILKLEREKVGELERTHGVVQAERSREREDWERVLEREVAKRRCLEAELTRLSEANFCFCMERDVNTAIIPCGHCMCSCCWETHEGMQNPKGAKKPPPLKCPICKAEVYCTQKLFRASMIDDSAVQIL